MSKKLLVILVGAVVAGTWVWYMRPTSYDTSSDDLQVKNVKEVVTFDECADAGFPVRGSYPPVCVANNGLILTQNIGNELELKDAIRISHPRPIQKVSNPIKVTGEARGTWFFEAQFSASILDENGEILGSGIMTADDEWMTENFVPYSGELTFEPPKGVKGELILEKNNPSGLLEHDEQLIVPVRF